MNETSTVQDRHLTPDRLGPPSFSEAFRFWLKLGFISFGGPSGQIAMMHTELVEKKRWIDNARFLHALNFCMLLPGPEAQQLAIYIGWLWHKTRGGIVAGALFVIPSIFIFHVPFPVIVVTAAVIGLLGGKILPQYFRAENPQAVDVDLASKAADFAKPSLRRALTISVIWIVVWALPLTFAGIFLGTNH